MRSLGRLLPLCGALIVLLATSLLPAQDAAGEGEAQVDAKAKAVMEKMAEYLAKRKSTAVSMEMKMVTKGGGFDREQSGKIVVRAAEPNLLDIEIKQETGGAQIISDGQKIFMFAPQENEYFSTSAAQNLSESDNQIVLSLLSSPYGLAIPHSGAAKKMLEGAEKGTYAGSEKLGEVACERVSLETSQGKLDLWIAAGDKPLPQQLVVDSSDRLRQQLAGLGEDADKIEMKMTLTFTGWETDFAVKTEDFAFDPPKDAKKIRPPWVQGPHPLLGEKAPLFAVDNLDAKEVKLEQHIGKDVVILDFWATWCGPCVAALPTISKVAGDYKKKGVVFYAVNLREEPETIEEFLQAQELKIPVLLDAGGEVGALYQAQAIPQTVIIGKDGKVQVVHVGLSPTLEKDLAAELDALLAGKDLATEERKKFEEEYGEAEDAP